MSCCHRAGRLGLFYPLLLIWMLVSPAATASPAADNIVHMLDYIAVDYPEFVQDGEILDEAEYQEQREFAGNVRELLLQLPAVEDESLSIQAEQLLAEIDNKADGDEVARRATALRQAVIDAYQLVVAPQRAPDLQMGQQLFAEQCSACHGADGHGDGPLAKGMEPLPSDFHDEGRMSVRSLYGLFNTVSLGVAGTAMTPFSHLSEEQRWAVAFYVATLRSDAGQLSQGEALWKAGQGQPLFRDLKALVTTTPREAISAGGPELAAVQAWLTAHPEAIAATASAPLDITREQLRKTLAAYQDGDRHLARQLAISAYLEGFELIEAALDNIDGALRKMIEAEMMALRSVIAAAEPAESVRERIERIEGLLAEAEQRLGTGGLSATAAFLSSLLILLREGLEAILVLAAIIAFVRKSGRHDALNYIHAGWIAAVALGALTWLAARYFINISGASREMTEGITALIAAAMLLYVGYWLHNKSSAQAWQAFVQAQVTSALGKRTLWAMSGIAFLAVYRELFEVILFYETLWTQAGPEGQQAVIGGGVVAALLLALLSGAILKYSVRLPIGRFFAATSALLVAMAVVFAGNGVAALQEAGVVESTAVNFIEIPLLGLFATAQGLAAQGALLLLIAVGVVIGRRRN